MSELDQLAQHRNAILLAEAIGWLHDYRKCSEEQLQAQSANINAQVIARNELTNRFNQLTNVQLTLSSTAEQLPDLLNQWSGQASNTNTTYLGQYLSRCHNTAHFDKQDPLHSSKQNYPGTQISTAFGFETAVGANLTTQLWQLPWINLTAYNDHNRPNLLTSIQNLFTTVGADTRRPINEISLWDWGILVGALYKSSLAAAMCGYQPATTALQWQLLAIRTNGFAYLSNVSRLPDLIARQKTLQKALDNVQTLLEVTYPLATEVYRDENGSLYVVPNLPNLLDLRDDTNQTLQSHIVQQFTTDGDIVPQITLDPTAWWGQDPNRSGNDQIPPAGKLIATRTSLESDPTAIHQTWQGKKNRQICLVCGLRPVRTRELEHCHICGERRKGRVVQWLQDQSQTIWLDEVADKNGRLALIVGTFDLAHWLDGSLVETLLVQEPTASNLPVIKNPSFARIQRIWRTTQTFWQESQQTTNQTLSDARRRLTLTLANQPSLNANQTYQLQLGSTRLSVLWDGEQLVSIDNLSYTAVQLNLSLPKEQQTPVDAALAVGVWLDSNKEDKHGHKNNFQLISDDEKNTQYGIQIADIDYQETAYATAIPILTEPRTFMALVPADKAIEIITAIKTKYEQEMGKVRNRLPLHLGVVYAQRRTPLRAVLDAGRRMLKYELRSMKDEVWTVAEDAQVENLPANQGTQFATTIHVQLEQNGRQLTWNVPAKMGDGQTDDNWYPYVFIKGDMSGRALAFQAPRPKSDGTVETCWLLHASQLKKGDKVYFTPATFDFEWLDNTGRRFEIAYDQQGKRRNHLTRPYLLDDLDQMQAAWDILQKLSKNQLYALRESIETKREAWFTEPQTSLHDPTFKQFCADVVANTKGIAKTARETVTDWAVSGLLADTVQLYVTIMKQTQEPPDNQETE